MKKDCNEMGQDVTGCDTIIFDETTSSFRHF